MIVAVDTETFPIRPGRQAPRVVCAQVGPDVARGRIYSDTAARDALAEALASDSVLVGHRIAYDALASIATWPELCPLWLAAYDADRVTDALIREKLARVAQGTSDRFRYSLADCVARYGLGATGPKDASGPRTRFHEIAHLDASEYPPEFRDYALGDLIAADVYHAQAAKFPAAWFADEFRQTRGALFLAYTSAWGMRIDPRAVRALGDRTEREHADARALLQAEGLVRPIGSKNTKVAAARMVAACAAQGLPIPRTEKGRKLAREGAPLAPDAYVALDADACKATLDPVLIAYARYTSIGTLRGRVDRLRLAGDLGLPVQPFFDPLLKTGRTSASMGEADPGVPLLAFGDQSHNLPREPGLRECYQARPGYWLLSADWKAAELHGLAQSCVDLGLDSQLGRVLVSGQDVHLWFACQLQGWAYDWAEAALHGKHGPEAHKAAKSARQAAKACMFGFPGGLGIEKFRLYARKQYGVALTDQEARERKGVWLAAFPEMTPYLAHAARTSESGAPLVHFGSWRYRGDLTYTSAANSLFQGRIADMLKDAGYRLTVACLPGGDLHGRVRPWNQAHDEILAEVAIESAHESAAAVVEIMEAVGAAWCPSCPVKAEPALQIHWRKGAEPAHDPLSGRLIPHEFRALAPATIEKIRKALDAGTDPVYVSWTYGIETNRVERIKHGHE